MAEVPDWQEWVEEQRKKFEQLWRVSGAVIVSCFIAGSFMLAAGAYVWFKAKY